MVKFNQLKLKNMNKQFIATLCILAVVGVAVGVGVEAADVQCTVTPGEISVSLNRTAVGYGIMLLKDEKVDPEGVITATAGTADVNLNFTGDNATYTGGTGCGDGTCTWTLAATPGTDIYKHSATIGSETALTKSAQTLVTGLSAGASEGFTLKMYTPTGGDIETELGNQYGTTVTVMAISS